ncbi:MAG: alpha/beta fold hydrolase, partial [Gemmatimonadales bacterium]
MKGERSRRLILGLRGISTAVDIQGDGPAILFVHGFPMDRTLWHHQMAAMRGWRRIAPDLRGMGLTEVADRYSMAEYADDMASLMDVLGASQAIVCGLSMGGYIAFEILRRHRKRVRALILSNTRAGADSGEGRANRDAMIDTVKVDGPAAVAEILVPKLLGPSS